MFSFGLRHGIRGKGKRGNIWKRRGGQPAIGIEVEKGENRGQVPTIYQPPLVGTCPRFSPINQSKSTTQFVTEPGSI
jgi:hypothetical protein